MVRRSGGLTKTQMNKFANLMAQFGISEEESKAATEVALYNAEQMMYEGQAVLNFFAARIKPMLDKDPKESLHDFNKRMDAAYHEWNFKICAGCDLRFAYAYHYEGVKYCSLDCLEKALEEIGIKFSRHKNLRQRWGRLHPAIVSSTALQTLEELYGSDSPSFA